MREEQRSSKWAFLIYKDSAPNYKSILDSIHVPYMLSPWHDKDIGQDTGEVKKAHKHGVLYFESLKSRKQVNNLLAPLNGPDYVEVVHSVRGMYDYFTHAESPTKAPYDVNEIEYGCGFNLEEFLAAQDQAGEISKILKIADDNRITEFKDLVNLVRLDKPELLGLLASKTFFFSKYIDSSRYRGNS